MFSFPRFLSALTKKERLLLGVFSLGALVSFVALLRTFYIDTTNEVATIGGTYIEGSVGDVRNFNPWFTVTNDVNRDVVSLVFAGLMKYDALSGNIIEDMATMDVSKNELVYTLKLKDGLFWHDTTEEAPHPVTADDVVFTYQTVQDEGFPNALLRQNFRGVTVEKIDDRTVQFRLEKPYAFFPSNLTLGIVPQSSFEGVPVDRLEQMVDFAPIGSGPYEFISMIQTDLSTEITLKRFEKHPYSEYKFERVVFRVFSEYSMLLSDIANLDGVRIVPRNEEGEPMLPQGFEAAPYTLPQYVALFFNLDKPDMQDRPLRLGLQLATNKQEIADMLKETRIVDTPLLELNLNDWRYQFDPSAAQGAMVESQWYLPEKIRLQRLQEWQAANAAGPLQFADQVVYLETGALLTLTGTTADLKLPATVNGVQITVEPLTQGDTVTMSGAWTVKIPTEGSDQALRIGMNRVRMSDATGQVIDSAFVERVASRLMLERSRNEQNLLHQYMESKAGSLPENKRIDIADLRLDNGHLRLKTNADPPSIRTNESGKALKLTLLTSPSPAHYKTIAEKLQEQWRSIGVDVTVEIPETYSAFEQRMLSREYDMLLFGQSLLDNLDSYPYWHSSQTQDTSGERSKLKLDAFNLSQYASFEADALLTRIRSTRDDAVREKALKELNELLKRDVPAIFLYSPLYVYGYRDDLKGVDIGNLASHSDRLHTMQKWYLQTERVFQPEKGWLSFFSWLPSLMTSNESDQ